MASGLRSRSSEAFCKDINSTDVEMGNEDAPKWAAAMQQDIINTLSTQINSLKDTVTDLRQKTEDQQYQIDHMKIKYQATHDRLVKLESYSMRENIIISGIAEPTQSGNESEDDLQHAVVHILENDLALVNMTVVRCHRLPSKFRKPRDTIVRIASYKDKKDILQAAKKLKGRQPALYINEQFPREIENKRRLLRPLLKMARERQMKATLVYDKILIDGKLYAADKLYELPFDMGSISTRVTGDTIMFSGGLSIYNNLYPQSFVLGGITYSCSEQFFQHAKATFMGNKAAAAAILMESDPVAMKRIGNSVHGDTQQWNTASRDFMYKAVHAKFQQSATLRDKMAATGSRHFVACDRYDTTWSNGLYLYDAHADDRSQWKGKNWIGEILENVRRDVCPTNNSTN